MTLSKQTKKDERKGREGRRRETEEEGGKEKEEEGEKGKGRERREEGEKKARRVWPWVVCQKESIHSELSLAGRIHQRKTEVWVSRKPLAK